MELMEACCSFSVRASHGVERFQCRDRRSSRAIAGGRNQVNDARRVGRVVVRSGGARDRSSADQLSAQEFFESFLRRRQAEGDFVSKAADALWKKEVIELDEEIRLRVRKKVFQLQKMKEAEDNGTFLRLSQARNWSCGQDTAPTNPNSTALERERARDDRKKQILLEYEALKRVLSLMTAGVVLCVSAYCFGILSSEATVSYGIGALARIGITSTDLQESIEKTIRGSSRALSLPRLVIPAALYGLRGLTSHFAENSLRLQVAPLLFGYFAYKAAVLVQAYRDNKDLFFIFLDPKGPEDA